MLFNRNNTSASINVVLPGTEGIAFEIEPSMQKDWFTEITMPGNRKFLVSLDGKVEYPDNKSNRNFIGHDHIVTLVVPEVKVEQEDATEGDNNNKENNVNNIPKKYMAKALVIESGKVVANGAKTPVKLVVSLKARREEKKMANYDAAFEVLQAKAEAMANSAG